MEAALRDIIAYVAREWVGVMLSVVGLVLSVTFWLNPRRKRQPTYSMRSNQLISSDAIKHQLEVRLKGKQVRDLVISRIAFWNAGTDAIRAEDCDVERKPLFRIESADGCRVLDLDFFGEPRSDDVISLCNRDSEGVFGLDFRYVSPGEGAVLTMAHEGGVQLLPTITMSMVNGKREALRRLDADNALVDWLVAGSGILTRKTAPWVLAAIALALMGLAVFFELSVNHHESLLVVGIIFAVGLSYLYVAYKLRSKMPEHLIGPYSE